MSHSSAGDQNLPNGLPPQFNNTKQHVLPEKLAMQPQQSFNGVDSSHSSRDSSPATRLQQIPVTQLPPSRSGIPASQLPPSWNQQNTGLSRLTQNYAQLSISSHTTPSSSPKPSPFGTSTPILDQSSSGTTSTSSNNKTNFSQGSTFSPISTSQSADIKNNPLFSQNNFTHSSTSQFMNVMLNTNSNDKGPQREISNAILPNLTHGNSNNPNNDVQIGPSNVPTNNQLSNNGPMLPRSIQNQGDVNMLQKNVQPPGLNPASNVQSSTMAKMHTSHSQPRLAVPPYNENLMGGTSNVQKGDQELNLNKFPTMKPMQSYGSTPNLYQGQVPPVSVPNRPAQFSSSSSFQHGTPPPSIGGESTDVMQSLGGAAGKLQTSMSNTLDLLSQPIDTKPYLDSGIQKLQGNVQNFPGRFTQPFTSGVQPTFTNSMQPQTTNSVQRTLPSSMQVPPSNKQGPFSSNSAQPLLSSTQPPSSSNMQPPLLSSMQPPSSNMQPLLPGGMQPPSSAVQPPLSGNVQSLPSSLPSSVSSGMQSSSNIMQPQLKSGIQTSASGLSSNAHLPVQQPFSNSQFTGSVQPPLTGSGINQMTSPNVPFTSGNVPQGAPNVSFQPRNAPQNQPRFGYPSQSMPLPAGVQMSAPYTGGQVPPSPVQNVPTSTSQTFKSNLHSNRYPTTSMNNQQQVLNTQATYQTQPSAYQTQVTQNQSNLYQNQIGNASQNQNQYSYQTQTAPRQPAYNQNNNQQYQSYGNYNQTNVVQGGFSKLWGQNNFDLLQCPNILPLTSVEPPKVSLGQEYLDAANCSPDIFRCTMTKIPESNSLLQKSRLPLGVLIHPFRDLNHLPVIQCNTIVRCRACRTYINPFVFFVDTKRWKCNLCYRVNELPEEFQYDPVSKTYGDPSRRPEVKSSTIEYIAPSEYMLRPPQPAVYIFLLDVSRAAVESGYLLTVCNVLTSNLTNLPGDARTQIGFIAYNSALHFYSLAEGISQPHEMTVLDVDDVFLPCPDNLVVNLQERMELVSDLLAQLPTRFNNSFDTGSALGAALQVAHKMISSTGGRVTVFQASLPTIGPGALTPREDPSQRAATEVQNLNPANDFYKRLALECSGQQVAVDLFIVNSQYIDLATISGISRFSGGCMCHIPLFNASRPLQNEELQRSFKRYLTRKIGFEAVMRIRCTRGLSIHTFHGNFFVRSTDLLSLPNVNPDAGFGMQVSIEESLSDLQSVCFQAALLYTSSKGERRIRVHTLCIPVASTLNDIVHSADQQCIIGLLAKMAVDRSMQSSLSDAREAFINVAIDILSSYKVSLNMESGLSTSLLAPQCLRLLPLYISALLKHVAFRTGTSTRLDDRVKAMCDMKTLPLYILIQQIYPDLYPIHNLEEQATIVNEEGESISQPPHLQLTARSLESKGAYLMIMGTHMIIYVCPGISPVFVNEVFGVPDYNLISDQMHELPVLENPQSQRLINFINHLNDEKPFMATLQVIKDNSSYRQLFIERLVEDRIETALSYHEFLQHLKTQVK